MLMHIKNIYGAKYIVNVVNVGSYKDSATGENRLLIEGDYICDHGNNEYYISVSMGGYGSGAFAIKEIAEMKPVTKGKKKFEKMFSDEFKRLNSTCT